MKKRSVTVASAQKHKGHFGSFFRDAQSELKKVEWPASVVVSRASFIIVVLVVFFASFVSGVDLGFSNVLLRFKGI